MKELAVKTSFSGVDIDVKFTDKINFIMQDSGTGKSYLFGLLSEYCQVWVFHVFYLIMQHFLL